MLPFLLGAAATVGMLGFGVLQSAVPGAGNAISACLSDDLLAAQQRVFRNNPVKELDPSALTQARLRNLISHDKYQAALSSNGINGSRADLLLETSRHLLSLENIADSYFKGDISRDKYTAKAAKLGFKEEEAEIFLISYRSIPSAENLIINLWRGNIEQAEFYEKMKGLGYQKGDSDLLIKAQYFLPSHEDLIRFQVRDVYNDNIVAKYGYGEEFPENIVADAKRIGMSRDTMMKFWKAHWDLPSPTQLYNMLQRLNPEVMAVVGDKYQKMGLDKADLYTDINTAKEMLKIADYPKYWRDRLVAISYDPITRVDLRRIYQLGLCSDNFVVATLQEHGYSHDDAALLLNFYQDLKRGKDKHLSQAALLKSYNYGLINKSEVVSGLKDLNFTDKDIEITLATNKAILDEKDFKELLEVWKVEYVTGKLSEDTVRSRLGGLGVTAKKTEVIMAKFKQANKKAVKMPPLADLAKFYKKGLLNTDGYRQCLSDSGIPDRFLDSYVNINQPSSDEG